MIFYLPVFTTRNKFRWRSYVDNFWAYVRHPRVPMNRSSWAGAWRWLSFSRRPFTQIQCPCATVSKGHRTYVALLKVKILYHSFNLQLIRIERTEIYNFTFTIFIQTCLVILLVFRFLGLKRAYSYSFFFHISKLNVNTEYNITIIRLKFLIYGFWCT